MTLVVNATQVILAQNVNTHHVMPICVNMAVLAVRRHMAIIVIVLQALMVQIVRRRSIVSTFYQLSLAILASYIMLIILFLDLIEISLVNAMGRYCTGKEVYVKVNGYQKGGNGEMVSCVVEKRKVEKGTTVKWNRGGGKKSGLKSCSNMVFDLTQDLPTVQVMTNSKVAFCPRSVEMEINQSNNGQITKRIICAKMEMGYYRKWNSDGEGRYNGKKHETTEGNCQ